MVKFIYIFIVTTLLYSCSPINKQHGYLMDDLLISSEKITNFKVNNTTQEEIYAAMGSPSIEINDISHVWTYLISLKEKKIFEEDNLLFQNVYRFVFDDEKKLTEKTILSRKDFNKITFSQDETKVSRNAYGITDQLYDAFTRGQ